MPKDPVCGMEGHIEKHGHFFCSQHCVEEYEKEIESCPTCTAPAKKWYTERVFIFLFITIALFVVSYIVPVLNPLFDSLYSYLKLIWWAILLGLVIGGVIDYWIPQEYITRYLAKKEKKTILYAISFGFLMSACSHGILAISMALYKKGASIPAVIAFLLASPWANLPVTILLFGLFGAKAILLVLGAIVIAVTTGIAFQVLDKKGLIEEGKPVKDVDENFSIREDLARRLKEYTPTPKNLKKDLAGIAESSWSLTKMVLWWILVGMILASFARTYVPHDLFMKYMGPTVLGLLVTLALATIIEVCSEGSSPMAFEIYNQTRAFGNSMTFLMAGVATDYTEIGLIWSNIGRKTALWLPVITVPQIILLGYLFNTLL